MIVLNPEGIRHSSSRGHVPVLRKLPDLSGKVIGFLDNGKPNGDLLQERFEELFKESYNVPGVVRRRKISAQQAAPKQHIEDLATQADFIINGLGD